MRKEDVKKHKKEREHAEKAYLYELLKEIHSVPEFDLTTFNNNKKDSLD